MRILITCTRLNVRVGTQMFVRDLARHLVNRGHSVFAFCSNPPHGERLLEGDVIPVATGLENLPFKPDIIHAQHHLEAMAALNALPGVPAVFHCNSVLWHGCPPGHPRILHHLAMSRTLAERLAVELNFAPADIRVAARHLVSIYDTVIGRQRGLAPDLPGEFLAVSRYLGRIAPLIMTSDAMLNRHWMSPERALTEVELSARLCEAEQRLERLEADGIIPEHAMRILITNNRLDGRGGSETFVRDLARCLQNLGHCVMAYTSDPAHRERLLENDLIPVATDLERLPFAPDIVHAQHHLDAMTALTALPDAPCVYHCRGSIWHEWAPRHPRIHRYLAVSPAHREWLLVETGVAPADVTVLPNSVDLARFRRVRTPPRKPARALFIHRDRRPPGRILSAVQEAAALSGLTLDLAGRHFGRIIRTPETLLPDYDVVFASGSDAIEAIACGCAVVVLGRTGCEGLVRPENFERLRQADFSGAANPAPASARGILLELDHWNAGDCATVTRRLREEADLRQSAEMLVGIYEDVIARHQAARSDMREELRAMSRYLRKIVPEVKLADDGREESWRTADENLSLDALNARLVAIGDRLDGLTSGRQDPGQTERISVQAS